VEPQSGTGQGILQPDTIELTKRRLLRDMVGLQAQLTRTVRDANLAADLLQDAVVTALQKLREGKIHDEAELDGYVYRVALNHFRNYRRKDRSHLSEPEALAQIPDSGTVERPTESLESMQWGQMVTKVLQELTPPRDRDLLVRFYLDEESKEHLCECFNLTDRHFNRVICRARERFRALLQERGLRKSDFLGIVAILVLYRQCPLS
jgi:RNA polymerase sigma-70 factor (ECF subfamily)